VFPRSEMDWVRRDKKMRRFPAAFELEMTFTLVGTSAVAEDATSTSAVVGIICEDAPPTVMSLPGAPLELSTP
jgi:hypothetical protein